ncbi:hypothetical protein OH491_20290 [Termitidicoccus mucosus]|uniref:Uncharacterized protein n=2 Tax=Termitidicoccus mucosus TaxID=1184151 RepID=A0A178IKE4_9BACT|nr:hypothetical protein AW736_08430 [Opitutaceae bacterium TSB47]
MFTLLALVALGAVMFALSRAVRIGGTAQAGGGGTGPAGGASAADGLLGMSRIDGDRALGTALEEQAVLFDPTPLFLPTARNASHAAIGMAVRREPGEVFRPFPPRLVFSDSVFAVAFPDPLVPPSAPAAALEIGRTANPYVPLGRFERELPPLAGRLAFVEVLKAASGEKVLAVPFNAEEPSTGADFGVLRSESWRPMELLASLDSAGFTGAPLIVQGSGSDRVDKIVREMLTRKLHLGQRLQAGFYVFRVGP